MRARENEKAAFVWIEPWLNRLGIVVPFYGWIKVLFLLYLCLTRPSVGPSNPN